MAEGSRTAVWALVHAERRALIVDLEGLSPGDWEVPSLCADWSVHDVAGHLVDNAKASLWALVRDMAVARFDFDAANDLGVRRERGATPSDTLHRLRTVASVTTTAPLPIASRLVEEVVHGEDVRRPLGIVRAYPDAAVLPALDHQARTSVRVGGGREHLDGLTLVATDAEVQRGEGPEVVGPAVSMLLAGAGRTTALDDLEGPGAATLRARLEAAAGQASQLGVALRRGRA